MLCSAWARSSPRPACGVTGITVVPWKREVALDEAGLHRVRPTVEQPFEARRVVVHDEMHLRRGGSGAARCRRPSPSGFLSRPASLACANRRVRIDRKTDEARIDGERLRAGVRADRLRVELHAELLDRGRDLGLASGRRRGCRRCGRRGAPSRSTSVCSASDAITTSIASPKTDRRRRSGTPVGCARQRLGAAFAIGGRLPKQEEWLDARRSARSAPSSSARPRTTSNGPRARVGFRCSRSTAWCCPGRRTSRPRRTGRGRGHRRGIRASAVAGGRLPRRSGRCRGVHRARRRRGATRVRAGARSRRRAGHVAAADPRDQRFAGAGRGGGGRPVSPSCWRRCTRRGLADEEIALAVLTDARLADVGVLIDYVHRLQLRAAVWRRMRSGRRARRRGRGRLRRSCGLHEVERLDSTRRRSRTWWDAGRRSPTTRSRPTGRAS